MKLLTTTAVAGLLLLSGCSAPAEAEPTTPEACITALDNAETLDDLLIEAIDSSSRASKAALYRDADAIDDETAFIESITDEVQQTRASYDLNAAECRGE